MSAVKSICVFCGASTGHKPEHARVTRELATALVARGTRVIFGGGSVGLMGILADTVLERGGTIIGVLPRALDQVEVTHTGLSALHLVDSMHQRKAMMADLADAFIALPGGLGTLEELFEVWTWAQLELHDKPCGLLNAGGYFDPLIAFIDHAVAEGFIRPRHRALLHVDTSAAALLDLLDAAAGAGARFRHELT